MTDKTKKNFIYFGVGLVLVFIIKYFNLDFIPAMSLAVLVSGIVGYVLK
ncbi:hypothetical protein DFR79_1462 [Halanaerobium saccharolyticum]|uniref:Uncharacterized protein n=1 Tax=Halanaerobium saccharolyticum TaxID=43595 RepID=A0A4R6L9G8_9FIRM|nr:hypothetical protein [Halanaerobium saccharolyticum]TDO71345.1 hypothetical protein DFR79_1462 [Halanaerobium saccharolyticum]